jgi:hypothetical protein
MAKAYENLLAATTVVTIPTGTTVRPEETILGQIVDSLRLQTSEYRVASLCPPLWMSGLFPSIHLPCRHAHRPGRLLFLP